MWENIQVLPCLKLAWLEGLLADPPLSNSLSEALEKQMTSVKDENRVNDKEDNMLENPTDYIWPENPNNSIRACIGIDGHCMLWENLSW